jgi:chromosome segregation ATPase
LIGRCRKQQRELQESWEKGHTALQDKHAEVVTMLKEQQQSLDKLTLDKTQLASEYSALEQKHAELERAQKAREGRHRALQDEHDTLNAVLKKEQQSIDKLTSDAAHLKDEHSVNLKPSTLNPQPYTLHPKP